MNEAAPMYVDWEYYKIFYFVAKYRNFTKAARVLGSNQPNITHTMNKLEDQLHRAGLCCRDRLSAPRGGCHRCAAARAH